MWKNDDSVQKEYNFIERQGFGGYYGKKIVFL